MHAYSSGELALIPANRTSYARRAAASRPGVGWFAGVKAFFERQSAIREMSGLTDRELHDIGLNRSDLDHVFDHGFVSRLAD